MSRSRPVVLIVCDGWGCSDDAYGNAIAAARTPVVDALVRAWPSTEVAASGEAVGLPRGQQGNSEVGHLTIGSGRVILQDLPRISNAIQTGAFFDNPSLVRAVDRARDRGRTLHLLGLLSPGGVHSHQQHAVALAELARRRGLDRVAVHAFTDGRDEPPSSAAGFVRQFEDALREVGVGRVASISGRYFAMDRDRRWDRTRRAYDMLTGVAEGDVADALASIEVSYARGLTDEFLEPVAIAGDGAPRQSVADGDSVIFFNFRPDRARQLTHALLDDEFSGFPRWRRPTDLCFVTFTEYEAGLPALVAFAKEDVSGTLAETVSRAGLRQYHVAETEKYAHVTYFVNGGREEPFAGEERCLVPSPKVATYDLAPEMSALPVTDTVVERLGRGGDALVVVNFANPDMVGHTGDLDATVRAVEVVDGCLGRIVAAATGAGGAVLITSDHGNAERKLDARDGTRLTAHTTSPVPVILCNTEARALRGGGGLSDIAPTVLVAMGLPVPPAMTGRDLAER